MYISEVAGLQNAEEVWVACILITRKKKMLAGVTHQFIGHSGNK